MTANCRSNGLAAKIKGHLTMDEVARHYGFEPNRSGFMRCPFHQGDRTASLKIYPGPGGWHCFGCGSGGSVIDFVMRLFDLSFRQALVRLNTDFQLGLTGEAPSRGEASRILQERAREAKELAEYRERYKSHTMLYRSMWLALKDGNETPLYFSALRELPILDEWFDEHPWR